MNWFDNAGRAPTVDETRARQIDFALQRVRQTAMKAELDDMGAHVTAAQFANAGQETVAKLLAGANEPTGYHYHLVALAFNALLTATRSGNAAAADTAAVAVASAAVRMVGAWQVPGGGSGGRAA